MNKRYYLLPFLQQLANITKKSSRFSLLENDSCKKNTLLINKIKIKYLELKFRNLLNEQFKIFWSDVGVELFWLVKTCLNQVKIYIFYISVKNPFYVKNRLIKTRKGHCILVRFH